VQVNPAALTSIRELAGYKKSTLASLAGISPSYLTEMEKGDKPGSPEVIKKLADALGQPVAALICVPESSGKAS
jgi:transcriptional regulator with XRE-family HTH domain